MSREYDTFLIGHISSDEIWEADGTRYPFFGGAGLYGVYAAHNMGASVGLLTKMTPSSRSILDLLCISNEDIYFVESAQNTSMINRYLSEDRERRELIVSSVAEPFHLRDVPDHVQSKLFHIAGLVYGDYDEDMIRGLASRGKVAVDMQGYLRRLDPATHRLYYQDFERKREDFPLIDFLKVDAAEAEVLTGLTDRKDAIKKLYDLGAKETVLTFHTEIMAFDGSKIYTCPIRSRNFSGRSGRGDTAFSVYTTERLSHSVEESLAFAGAAVSLKMECRGPLKKSREDVLAYQRMMY